LLLKLPKLNPKSSHGPSLTAFDDGFCNHSKDESVMATLIAASPARQAFDFVLRPKKYDAMMKIITEVRQHSQNINPGTCV